MSGASYVVVGVSSRRLRQSAANCAGEGYATMICAQLTNKVAWLLPAMVAGLVLMCEGAIFGEGEPQAPLVAVAPSVMAPAPSATAGTPTGVTPPIAIPAPVPPTTELVTPPLPAGTPVILPTNRPITVKEAIAAALQHQSQVAIAAAAARAAAGATRQAESAYFPTVSVSARHTRVGPAGTTGSVGGTFTVGGYTTTVGANQLIYDFGKTPAAVGQARRLEESAQDSLALTRQDTVNAVKQAYYTLLENQRLVEVQQANVAAKQASLDLARARFTAGVAPRADVISAEAALASAAFNLATAQNAAAVSRVTLNTSIGTDVRTPIVVEETEEEAPAFTPDTLVQDALSTRRDVAQSRAQVSAAEEALRVARTNNLPDVSVFGDYGLRGSSFIGGDRSWSYGVSIQWPFFDVGLTAGRVEQAKGNLDSARAQLVLSEQNASANVVQAYLNLQTAEQKVASAAAEVANAEESLRVAMGRYQAGVAIYIEVINAQTALVTARTDQVNALYGLSIARAALKLAMGIEEQ